MKALISNDKQDTKDDRWFWFCVGWENFWNSTPGVLILYVLMIPASILVCGSILYILKWIGLLR